MSAARQDDGAPAPGRVLLLAPLHVLLLVAIRLWTDADDFNNWDLIGFLNSNAFPTMERALGIGEVHFRRPFSFPMYNTGAESVISTIVHRAASSFSLYWSNTAVLIVHDAMFFAALAALLRLVLRDRFFRAVAWMLVAMSPVLLTFPSTLAFDMQGFATIAIALVACESILSSDGGASRSLGALVLLAYSYLSISQAYPLTFFLPLFGLVWTASRAMQRGASSLGLDREFLVKVALCVATIVAATMVVEAGSNGTYLAKAFGVVASPLQWLAAAPLAEGAHSGRAVELLSRAFFPSRAIVGVQPAFAPFGVLAVLLATTATWFARVRPATGLQRGQHWRVAVTVAAWTGLIAFGYMPAAFGVNAKSQRCFFGDLFLVVATASFLQSLLSRADIPRRRVVAGLLLLMVASDLRYLSTVLAVDHTHNHEPVFDFDPADGIVRHDLQSALRHMKQEVEREGAALIVHYPRSASENSTDPGLFYARMLRFFGPWQDRSDVIFTCRICNPRYGCPFPEVAGRGCSHSCCWKDPVETLSRVGNLRYRRVYLWWYVDPVVPASPSRERALQRLTALFTVRAIGSPGDDGRWEVFQLTPRSDLGVRRSSGRSDGGEFQPRPLGRAG